MNEITAIGLKDVGVFKDQLFAIPKGISVIYGLNRASGAHSKNSNGVGKSHLVSSVAEMLYDDPIIGEKSDRTREGTRTLHLVHKGKTVLVTREARGKSDKVSVAINGRDPEFLTATKAKAALRKYWPITQEQYNTYVHIDSRIPHPLVMGSTTERKNFFTSFFGLDKMDAERKIFASELSALKKTRAAYDELRAAYDEQKASLTDPEQLALMERFLAKAAKKAGTMQARAEAAQEAIRVVQFMAQQDMKQLEALKVALHGEWSTEAYERAKETNAFEYKKAKTDLADAREYAEWQVGSARYKKAMEGLPRRALALISKYGPDKAGALCNKKAGLLESLLRANGHLVGEAPRIKARIEKLEAVAEVKRPEMDVGEAETLRRAYKHQLEHARKFKSGTCDSCGSIVKIKDPAELADRLNKAQRTIERHKAADEYAAKQKELKGLRVDLEQAIEVTAEAEALTKYADLAYTLRQIPSEPPKFEGAKLEPKVMERVWDEVRERRQLLEFFAPHVETLIEAINMPDEQRQAAKEAQGFYEELSALQQKAARAEAKLEAAEAARRASRKMRTRLKEMKAQLKDEQALKLLVTGHGDKQMKKMAIEAIGSRLMQVVNKYARIVFPEDYYFSFEWGTQINMLVHRRYGKKVKVTDVRKLSGAESKLFTLILVLALLSFVPEERRSNVLFLDEPTANFHNETTQALADILPVLNQLITSIVIITPKSEERYEGAAMFTVVKTNGEAVILPGHPEQVQQQLVSKALTKPTKKLRNTK